MRIANIAQSAASFTKKVSLIVGFVLAVAAAFKAFSDTMEAHYTEKKIIDNE